MKKEAYPYCIHGTYVGGCGIDYMCHACEMGDEAPTVNEQKAYMRGFYSREVPRLTNYVIVGNLPLAFMRLYKLQQVTRKLAREQSLLNEIRRWSTHDDDEEWPHRRYEAEVKAWNELSGEEQFNGLPAHVLEGAY